MSNLIKKPLTLEKDVTCTIIEYSTHLSVTISYGQITREHKFHHQLRIQQHANELQFSFIGNKKLAKQHITTAYIIIRNCLAGFKKPFTVSLKLHGVGYKAAITGNNLTLNVGFCHPVILSIPQHVNVTCPTQSEITVSSPFKDLAGFFASQIYHVKKPNPYQGIGVQYKNKPPVLKAIKKK